MIDDEKQILRKALEMACAESGWDASYWTDRAAMALPRTGRWTIEYNDGKQYAEEQDVVTVMEEGRFYRLEPAPDGKQLVLCSYDTEYIAAKALRQLPE